MTANVADNLTMTGRRLLRLDRALRRMARFDGMLAAYQDMLVSPLSRLNSIVDSLASPSLYGPGRVTAPLAWRPSSETYAPERPPMQTGSPESQPFAQMVSRNETNLAQPANTPITRRGSEALAHLPEAYLMSIQTGSRAPARQRRATMPADSEIAPGITRRSAVSTGVLPLPQATASPQITDLTPALRANIAADEAPGTRLRSLPGSSFSTGEGQNTGEMPAAGGRQHAPPGLDNQRSAAESNGPEQGSVRLSRGGASLMSILRHNLVQGQSSPERPAAGSSQGITPAPEGNNYYSSNVRQASPENSIVQDGPPQRHDTPYDWAVGETSRRLSPEQIDQIMDALSEQLEISLLRTYGTSRR